jgi:hypothetical protein|uniref:hypothetical protein n=1 Tax=Altererythrobacter segetis TaxID=1104773 RepID=UPI00140CD99B|nr:hypothetical protein [Altererythrobacter segetis]
MTSRISVLAMAAACGWAVPAQAQDSNGSAIQQQLDAMRQQMAQMAGQIATLQAELDQAQAKAASAQAAAGTATQAALAASDAAKAATDTAKATGDKAGAFASAAKWAADTKVSGRMYFNLSSVRADDAAGNTVENDGGFQVTRMYLGVDHKFSDVFSGNVTMDVSRVDNAGKNVGMGFYLKKAYLEAKLNPALRFRLGSADMPWIPYVEGIYGYRHIEKLITDLDGFGTSADWGVHALGDIAGGLISYQVSAVDGGGYRDPKFTQAVDVEGRVSLKYHGFNAAVGGYTGKLGNDVQGAPAYRTASRFNAMLAYKDKVAGVPVTIGGEYFTASNWKVLAAAPEDRAKGYSLFASVAPLAKWSAFGRYDWIKPNEKTAPLKQDDLWILGLQYSPVEIVDLALVYKRDDADGGLKIGNLGTGQATRDEIGLYGQFRF